MLTFDKDLLLLVHVSVINY